MENCKNNSMFWLLARIWIILTLGAMNFKSGNFFLAHPVQTFDCCKSFILNSVASITINFEFWEGKREIGKNKRGKHWVEKANCQFAGRVGEIEKWKECRQKECISSDSKCLNWGRMWLFGCQHKVGILINVISKRAVPRPCTH